MKWSVASLALLTMFAATGCVTTSERDEQDAKIISDDPKSEDDDLGYLGGEDERPAYDGNVTEEAPAAMDGNDIAPSTDDIALPSDGASVGDDAVTEMPGTEEDTQPVIQHRANNSKPAAAKASKAKAGKAKGKKAKAGKKR